MGQSNIHIPNSMLYSLNFTILSSARWPSGLRRQLKEFAGTFGCVRVTRWSERAWVQIPLWSISFLYQFPTWELVGFKRYEWGWLPVPLSCCCFLFFWGGGVGAEGASERLRRLGATRGSRPGRLPWPPRSLLLRSRRPRWQPWHW